MPIEALAPFTDAATLDEIRILADKVRGKRWADLNTSTSGGGVAEILRGVLPLMRGLGVDARWYTLEASDQFFGLTKTIHNMLHGEGHELSDEALEDIYLATSREAGSVRRIDADLALVHDPQPLALIDTECIRAKRHLWRCHVDTEAAPEGLRVFLNKYVNRYDAAVFTSEKFVFPETSIPTIIHTPVLNPLDPKNRSRSRAECFETLQPLFAEHAIDPERPVVAAISRYDRMKNQGAVLEAFLSARGRLEGRAKPQMIFLGNTAPDDPEGAATLAAVQDGAKDDPDVSFWVNVENNKEVVGALMSLAAVFVHVPTREGFGLVVTEALWQRAPVIGSPAGGVPLQVKHEQTGLVADPSNPEEIAEAMARIIEDASFARQLGDAGHAHVRDTFLVTAELKHRLSLLAEAA